MGTWFKNNISNIIVGIVLGLLGFMSTQVWNMNQAVTKLTTSLELKAGEDVAQWRVLNELKTLDREVHAVSRIQSTLLIPLLFEKSKTTESVKWGLLDPVPDMSHDSDEASVDVDVADADSVERLSEELEKMEPWTTEDFRQQQMYRKE